MSVPPAGGSSFTPSKYQLPTRKKSDDGPSPCFLSINVCHFLSEGILTVHSVSLLFSGRYSQYSVRSRGLSATSSGQSGNRAYRAPSPCRCCSLSRLVSKGEVGFFHRIAAFFRFLRSTPSSTRRDWLALYTMPTRRGIRITTWRPSSSAKAPGVSTKRSLPVISKRPEQVRLELAVERGRGLRSSRRTFPNELVK